MWILALHGLLFLNAKLVIEASNAVFYEYLADSDIDCDILSISVYSAHCKVLNYTTDVRDIIGILW